ncbi:MAG: Ca-activated chloride channel [Acidobacteriota bacterium]|jgi:Ca-activated chloride channel family protein|nr:Ca-activated chloride channel [Acidobacteriota bacterium]
MKEVQMFNRVRRAIVVAAVLLMACALLVVAHVGQAQSPDGRARRTTAAPQQTPKPVPTPTPKPGLVRPGQVILSEPPPEMANPLGAEIDEGGKIKIDTDLVNLNVRVIDRNNHPIGDIRQDEVHVFENGVPQPIFSFTKEEVPISYGLAIDTSGSMRSQLNQVIEAGKTIINSNKPGDETFLVRFISSDKIEQVLDFTSKKDDLLDSLDTFYIEGGQTAVIDAVYVTAEHVAEYKKGSDNDRRRRALIVVTDGEDRVSSYTQEQLFDRLREEDVQIFVIGFVNELEKEGGVIRKSPHDKAVNLLNRIAKETGGRAFFPGSLSELPQIADEIVRDLRTQYVVSYSPTNKARDGSYRAIRVAVADAPGKDKRIALTRSGRLAGSEGNSTPVKPPVSRTTNSAPTQKSTGRNP